MKKNRKVTIKDVAERANVSITTVSLVLNNKSSTISKETIEKVKKCAYEINYFPDPIAASMITKKTKTIGYILPNIENTFFAKIVKSVETELISNGYNLIISNSNESFERDKKAIMLLNRRNVDFLIYTPSIESLQKENINKINDLLSSNDTPYLLVDREILGLDCNKIVSDNEYGGYLATRHLIENGHKSIACISGPLEVSSAFNRYNGYLKALKEAGIDNNDKLLLIGNYSFESGYELGLELIKRRGVTAVFVTNDLMAYGVIKACKEHKIKIPNDLSIVGYDDLFYSAILEVPLTSVNQNVGLIAKRVSDYVFNALKNKTVLDSDVEKILIQPKLVIRNSVANKVL
jgi:LacI family transcriptional regulator